MRASEETSATPALHGTCTIRRFLQSDEYCSNQTFWGQYQRTAALNRLSLHSRRAQFRILQLHPDILWCSLQIVANPAVGSA